MRTILLLLDNYYECYVKSSKGDQVYEDIIMISKPDHRTFRGLIQHRESLLELFCLNNGFEEDINLVRGVTYPTHFQGRFAHQ